MKKSIIVLIFCMFFIVITILILLSFFPKKYNDEISVYAEEFGLNTSVVASVINIESGYDKMSVSSAGALGLMQLLPTTANECARKIGVSLETDGVFDVSTNIRLGCYYLSYLLELYKGNIINALCAYNWGMRNVSDWIAMGNVDSDGTITNIPVEETQRYIKKFKVCFFVYDKVYGY